MGTGEGYPLLYSWASLVAQLVKNLPELWETWVRSLGWEDPLEKVKATHSSILARRIPKTVYYSPWGHKQKYLLALEIFPCLSPGQSSVVTFRLSFKLIPYCLP